jgi:hypothetical protein
MFTIALLISSITILVTDPKLRKKASEIKGYVSNKAGKIIPFYREIYRNSSWQTLAEFIIFKLRSSISVHLETGLLVKPKTNFYDLIYYDGVNRYVVRFPRVRGPSKIFQITDDQNTDVTDKIKEYLGPSHNFHGISTSPALLGYKSLTFEMIDGQAPRILKFVDTEKILF